MHTGYDLLASTNNRNIRMFDLRSQSGSSGTGSGSGPGAGSGGGKGGDGGSGASITWTTRAVYGLSPDPLSNDRFASFEPVQGQQPSVVRIWDRRMAGEVLSFEMPDSVHELEWDGRGGLGVGMKSAGVQVWEIANGTTVGEVQVMGVRQGERAYSIANLVQNQGGLDLTISSRA